MQADHHASDLRAALRSCRGAFVGVGLMSAMISVLYLTGSFFMLEVYDRVIPSRSVPTLVSLGILVVVLYAVQGVLDAVRARVLARIGEALDEALAPRVFDAVMRMPLMQPGSADRLMPLRDLDQVRTFLSGAGPTALFDLHPAVIIIGWAFAGAGMGLMYPRLTVLTLAYSTPQNQGFNSSALSISDSVGAATSIAVMGLVFTALVGTGGESGGWLRGAAP